jgi:hypothetical protein
MIRTMLPPLLYHYSKLHLNMRLTLFGAGFGACFAADTVFRVRNRHYLVAHVVAVFVLSFKRLLDECKHILAADLVAAAAADAFMDINRVEKSGDPLCASPCASYNACHIPSPSVYE